MNTGCNGTLHKRSKFVRVIFIQYKKRFYDVVVKPFKNHHQLFFDNAYNTLIKRFIKTKPNWNQYKTFWKRYVFSAGLVTKEARVIKDQRWSVYYHGKSDAQHDFGASQAFNAMKDEISGF